MRIEQIILGTLTNDESFIRESLPFIKPEYFLDPIEGILFKKIRSFVDQYNTVPTKGTLAVEINKDNTIGEAQYTGLMTYLDDLSYEEKDATWLRDNTEKFCQERAIYNAIQESISIIDGEDDQKDKGAIPEILSNALSVSFDKHIGHDFIDDASERYDFYHHLEERIAFDLDFLNRITKGGFPNKSLNVLLAGTGVGKTLAMCHMASANLLDGKNVLYITMEMAEERIAERIDANLLNIPLDELANASKEMYMDKVGRIKSKTAGKLIIKEYPTAAAGAGHFRHLLNELKLKKDFVPDIIYIDYLNICMSSRLKNGANVGSYTYIKSIAEELRGLAVEMNLPIVSATQLNRTGFTNSDPGLEDTSESFGLPATVDWMAVMITSEVLAALGQIMFKQLKNRYCDIDQDTKFVVGIDKSKMRLFDVDQEAQEGIHNGPVMDQTPFGKEMEDRSKKNKFSTLFNE